MEQIYLHSLPIKEYQIVDFFLPKLKDEVMKVSMYNFLLRLESRVKLLSRSQLEYLKSPGRISRALSLYTVISKTDI